jgi:hypothetical protein
MAIYGSQGTVKVLFYCFKINSVSWIKDDWQSNKFRFVIEVLAWLISIGCSVIMAITVPNPPLVSLYPLWIAGCAMYAG